MKRSREDGEGSGVVSAEGNTRVPGLWVEEDLLSEHEERAMLAAVAEGEWSSALKRRVQHYGYTYSYKSKSISLEDRLGPLPPWCAPVLAKLAARGLQGFDQMIVNEYTPGQGIARHVDSPTAFGPCVVSVSLGSDAVMTFTNKESSKEEPVHLKRRSGEGAGL